MSQSHHHQIVVGEDTHPEHSYHQTSNGRVTSIFPAHQKVSSSTLKYSTIQPVTAVPSTGLVSGSYVEYYVPYINDKIREVAFEWNVTNSSGGALNMPPAHLMIDKLEIYSGSTLLTQIRGVDLYSKHCVSGSAEHIAVMSGSTNVSSLTYDSFAATLADIASRTFLVDVTCCLEGLVPGLIREQIRYRVHFEKMSVFSSGNTGLALNSAVLYVESSEVSDEQLMSIREVYNTGLFTHRYIEFRHQEFPLTIQPSTKYTLNLSAINGEVIAFLVYARATGATDTNLVNFHAYLNQIHFTDANGRILSGGNIPTIDLLRYMNAKNFPSNFLSVKNVYVQGYSKDIYHALMLGTHSGSVTFSGVGETMVVTTTSTVPANTTETFSAVALMVSGYRITSDGTIIALR